MLNKKLVKADADAVLVAQSLGMTTHRRGNRYLVLCPFHNDRKIGSCYIDRKGLVCYSCGKKADVFDLVCKKKDVSFAEAVEYVAEICGGSEYYQTIKEEDMQGFLPAAEREKLGLSSTPVFTDAEITTDYSYARQLREEGVHVVEREDNAGNCFFVAQKCAEADPLYALFRTDLGAYKRLIDDFCQRRIDALENILKTSQASLGAEMFERHGKAFMPQEGRSLECCDTNSLHTTIQETAQKEEEYVSFCKKLRSIVGAPMLASTIQSLCKEFVDISEKYGDGNVTTNPLFVSSFIANGIWEEEDSAF